MNIFSPNKGDLYWLSIRSTIGRDQKSVQGYLFSELITTIPVMKKLYVNINPKYAWSSIKSTGGIGLSLNYQFNNKFSIIPEMNLNFRDNNDNNNSLSIRYFINEKKSLDFYYTNALGIQDMSQLVRSKENKFGIKYNLYF